ncbi:MAG: ABC transporter ATP-binding protein [Prevotellaceae bacterium]|jgi:lipoprotein-releasing system ATP-binding protein|nr:ABC transporter ATP-binding protein [Prevotellaceae bacterium]
MIKASNITKSFGSLQVLKGVDLQIAEKEIVTITGASGAGKTTLLQILGTLDKADSGIIEINGVNINKLNSNSLSEFRNRTIGFVFQFHQLMPEFSAVENVMMPALISGESFKSAEIKAKKLLDFLQLSHRLQHRPAELSGGEKQRVAVARALINTPKVIFADEPSGSLDSKNKAELHRLFLDLRDNFNLTILIVTHDRELSSFADRNLVMSDGMFV